MDNSSNTPGSNLDNEDVSELVIPLLKRINNDTQEFNVYTSELEFVTVQAETVISAIEKSNVSNPIKVIRMNCRKPKIIHKTNLESDSNKAIAQINNLKKTLKNSNENPNAESKHSLDSENSDTESKNSLDSENPDAESKNTLDSENPDTESKHTSDNENPDAESKNTLDSENPGTESKHTSDNENSDAESKNN